ncbi:MAG: 3-dehydroquinate synthase [Saccharofermentans sp.]|nr:3-dehydroquinate synthase [Saccharofermentans sp.]
MRRVTVECTSNYDVLIGSGLLSGSGSLIKQVCPKAQKVLIVSETNVAPLYLDKVKSSLTGEGFLVSEYVFEAGEERKNIDSIAGMWNEMAKEGFTRTDIVVALGGGVTGDMAGFAAATFLRGIKVCQIPTSLLAMVDACIGGKTGIDLIQGKNQVGAFHQPSIVIEDTDCLNTLPDETFTEGMGEVIKYAYIMDTELYEILTNAPDKMNIRADKDLIEDIIARCAADKAYVIKVDENDNGLRQTLNYGHTVGHIIERDSDFTLAHGVCVAKGMGIVIRAAVAAGRLAEDEAGKMLELIEAYGLPTEDKITPEEAASGILNDKKKRGNTISVILVTRIGTSEIVKMTPDEFLEFLKKGQG